MLEIYVLLFKVSIVLIVGFIGALLARKLKLPNVSGYLILGLLLGPSMGMIFNGFEGVITVKDSHSLEFISEIALAFIAFSIGSEFAVKTIKKMGKSVLVLTTFEVIGAVLVVFLAMLFLPKPGYVMSEYLPFSNKNIAFGLVLASMSAATAPAATMMVIRQYRAYGPVTKTILPVTALDDIFGIIVFGFFISLATILVPQGGTQPVWLMFSKPFIEVFGSVLVGGLIGYVLAKLANKYDKIRDDMQVLSLIAIFFSIGLASIVNHYLHDQGIAFSQLLMNIMIGTSLANFSKNPDRTFSAINDFSTPFYVLFFTLAGASLDLAILKSDTLLIWIALVYIIARASGKILGIMTGAVIMKSPDTVRKYLGIALLPQGGISIGLLVIVSAQLKGMYPAVATVIMLSILVYETFGPVFAKFAIGKAGEIGGMDRLEHLSSIDDLEIEGGH